MPDQVVTELVIDADTSGADRFSQAMSGAEQAANGGLQSVDNMNVSFIALGTGALAALAGIKVLTDYVAGANKDLAVMQTTAHEVGLTLKDFQGVQLGGAIAGLDPRQINAGLEKSASLLNDAARNSNSLSKELDANGISVKNANGQLISENQLLGIAADLVKKAQNPGDQIAIAQMLGFTKEWIPLLQQGSGAMADLGQKAQDAGAVIDDETVQRAADFDKQWRASSAEFSAYMKSTMVGLLPYVDDLIEKAQQFVKGLDRKQIEDFANKQLKELADPAGLPDEAALKIDVTPEAKQAIDDISNAATIWEGIAKTFTFFASRTPVGNVTSLDPSTVPGYAASKLTEPEYPSGDQMEKSFGKYWKDMDKASDAAQDASDKLAGGFSKVAARGSDANDILERAINTVNKHTAQTAADADAVGLGAGALAGFRAEAQLVAAAIANGTTITPQLSAKFKDLAADAADAAADLAKVKVAADIKFSGDSAFLSAEDVKIATQLKSVYGNDIPTALASSEAAAIRANDAFRGISTGIENSLVSGLTDITTGAKSAGQGFADMSNMIIKSIEQMIIKIMVVEPLLRALQSGLSGFGFGGTAQGPMPDGSVVASAHGNIFGGGNVIPFAQGGVVGGPTMAPMALFGEAGPEAIVPLRRGADGNLGVASSGGGKAPQITVNLVEDSSRAGQTQQSSNDGGGFDLTVFVDSITAKNAANPGSATSQVLAQRGRLASR